MRSLPQLQAEAAESGIDTTGLDRTEIMDLLRARGAFEPEFQIDPMKAVDSKRKIDWTAPDLALPTLWAPDMALEPKIDGARMRLFMGAEANTMNTGRRSDRTYAYIQRQDNFPHLRDAAVAELAGTILDGEVLAPKAKITTSSGVVTNSLLNATVALTNSSPEKSVAVQAREGKVTFTVFDILAYKGESTMDLTYDKRRALLEAVVELLLTVHPDCKVSVIPSYESTPENVHLCIEAGFEGAMIKNRNGKYMAGKRSSQWTKIKKFSTLDAFVTGYLPGEGKNAGRVGAVKMSLLDDLGFEVEIAQHGAFTDKFRDELTLPDGSLDPKWLGTVMEITGQGVTKSMRIRHPHLVRLRPDKTREECTLDQLDALPSV